MSKPIKVLLISDRQTDFDQIQALLPRTIARLDHCKHRGNAERRVRNGGYDTVLLVDTDTQQLLHERWLRDFDPLDPPVVVLLRNPGNGGLWEHLALADLTRQSLLDAIDRARKQHQRELRVLKQAQCDALTGLASRLRFRQHLDDCLAHTRRDKSCCALLKIAVDGFEALQRGLGDDAADELLISVAERLLSVVRTTDVVARMTGAEFTILATQLHAPAEAARLAQGIVEACHFGDTDLSGWGLGVSIGIALFPADAGDEAQLLHRADEALQRARARGGNTYSCADPELDALAHAQQQLRADLGHALMRGEMELRFQPQIDLRDRSVHRVEVLLRWRHPQWGLLAPENFLAGAESNGVIHALGTWVLRKACAQRQEWRDQGLPSLALSFNVSDCQLERSALAETMTELVHEGVPVHCLGLEFNASLLAQCSESSRDLLTDLYAAGFPLAVDHFSGAECSLAQLRRVPVTALKIDRRLVRRLDKDQDSAALTDSIIQISHALRCSVVATGVETRAAASYLGKRRCDQLQGFYISRPLTGAELPRWLQRLSRSRIDARFG